MTGVGRRYGMVTHSTPKMHHLGAMLERPETCVPGDVHRSSLPHLPSSSSRNRQQRWKLNQSAVHTVHHSARSSSSVATPYSYSAGTPRCDSVGTGCAHSKDSSETSDRTLSSAALAGILLSYPMSSYHACSRGRL